MKASDFEVGQDVTIGMYDFGGHLEVPATVSGVDDGKVSAWLHGQPEPRNVTVSPVNVTDATVQ